jgi:hypothetical protein
VCAGVSGFGVVGVLDDASGGQEVGVALSSVLSRSGGLPVAGFFWCVCVCEREREKEGEREGGLQELVLCFKPVAWPDCERRLLQEFVLSFEAVAWPDCERRRGAVHFSAGATLVSLFGRCVLSRTSFALCFVPRWRFAVAGFGEERRGEVRRGKSRGEVDWPREREREREREEGRGSVCCMDDARSSIEALTSFYSVSILCRGRILRGGGE